MKKNNLKRAGAILGVVLLLAVFCLPMVFALGKGENAGAWFRASLGAVIILPVVLYAFLLAAKVWGNKRQKAEGEIENIIFDVGRVLVSFDWETYLKGFGFPEEKYEKIADATFRSNIWNERDRGLLEEEEYVEQMVKEAPEYEKEIREVMEGSYKTISVMDYAETWTKYLRSKGYRLYILSNYGHYMLERNRPDMGFLEEMDGAVFSCEVKQIKPEPEIYHTLMDIYHIEPEKSVFIDDRADNCEAAKKLGIHAVEFKSFKQAAAELEKLGVK